ncbi:MAG: DUF4011 domain-containing protein [Succinivibrionaceae bacterium]|nr:DUF4011 domain-containing protein [Succinivibrionaceae bacterium]
MIDLKKQDTDAREDQAKPSDGIAERSAGIAITIESSPCLNLSLCQTSFQLIRDIRFESLDNDHENISIRISCPHQMFAAMELKADLLQKSEVISVANCLKKLCLASEKFAELTETISSSIDVEVKDHKGETIASKSAPLEVTAFNQWTGDPELLACFVTPNSPAVAEIITRGEEKLKQLVSRSDDEIRSRFSDTRGFLGYRENDQYVALEAEALYLAMSDLGLSYRLPPASFHRAQRIRLFDMVIGEKAGTCLDTACFCASMLEAVGLQAVIIVFEEHAFAGVLINEHSDLTEAVITDRNEVFRAIETQQLLIFETTCLTRDHATFGTAVEQAKGIFAESGFKYCVNVRACRRRLIRPLPTISRDQDGSLVLSEDPRFVRNNAITDPSVEIRRRDSGLKAREKLTKVEIWENKLLDLTTRNRLLNMRTASGAVLRVLFSNPELLEDTLRKFDDRQFKLTELDIAASDLKDAMNSETKELCENLRQMTEEYLSASRSLYVLNESKRQFSQLLKKIASEAKSSYDENGANSLFLSLYSVSWSDDTAGRKSYEAPLLLLPVDIIRDTRRDVYSIRVRDEEPVLNYSLTEMMRQLFGINLGKLDVLPTDDYGVDVGAIKDAVQDALPPGWKILKTVCLGNFSFRKFVMWRDLNHNSSLLEAASPVYHALATGKFTDVEKFDSNEIPATVDERISYGDLCQPVLLDSSQLDALKAADTGKSFVLQGPPGTGKSQTITSIIASALSKGKKVLFVAAKMAALEVVQARLEALGLAPYCLELHSNTLTKSRFLEKLELQAPDAGFGNIQDKNSMATRRLNAQRDEINQELQALHAPVLLGMSVYCAMSRLCQLDIDPSVILSPEELKAITQEDIETADTAMRELAILAKGAPLDEYTYYGSALTEPPSGRLDISSGDFQKNCQAITQCADIVASRLGISSQQLSFNRLLRLIQAASDATSASRLNLALIGRADWKDLEQNAEEALEKTLFIQNAIASLGPNAEDVFQLNLREEKKQWQLDDTRFFLFRLISHSKSVGRLQRALGADVKISSENYLKIVNAALEIQETRQRQAQLASLVGAADAALADLLLNRPEEARTGLDLIKALHASLFESSAAAEKKAISRALKNIDPDEVKEILESIGEHRTAAEDFSAAVAKLAERYAIEKSAVPEELHELIRRSRGWLEKPEELKSWLEISLRLSTLTQAGYKAATDALKSGQIATDAPDGYATAIFAKSLVEWQFCASKTLQSFNHEIFEDKVSAFAGASKDFNDLSQQMLCHLLRNQKQRISEMQELESEVAFFEKAKRSRGRNLTIRQIFGRIPHLLPRIAPCMLMSPISVAQYLTPDLYRFDLVLFDEASQLPTAEAAGAIGRGAQVIVVGDPKQMPPTDFFEAKRDADSDDIDADLESVLDDCMSLGMPTKTLSWHYRSRHESLIAFSNVNYYDGMLYTFPSPDDMSSKIEYHYVNGLYERGGAGVNRDESREVTEYVKNFIDNDDNAGTSIGIVTFNSRQQGLIEDDLQAMFRMHPETEKKADAMPVPLFVKNLENVQGDERDVIVFSVGFGKDKSGKVSMSFGPLNRDGGERRLNVALTRAKKQMVVFTSMEYEDGRLTPTTAKGVVGLFEFLKYARNGSMMTATQLDSRRMEKDWVVRELAEELKARGFDVRIGIGSSAFRIDLAVRDPSDPARYLACIMADGIVFRNTPSAADRFIGQPGMLCGLGWNVLRFWTVDWWRDRKQVTDYLCEQLRSLTEISRATLQ